MYSLVSKNATRFDLPPPPRYTIKKRKKSIKSQASPWGQPLLILKEGSSANFLHNESYLPLNNFVHKLELGCNLGVTIVPSKFDVVLSVRRQILHKIGWMLHPPPTNPLDVHLGRLRHQGMIVTLLLWAQKLRPFLKGLSKFLELSLSSLVHLTFSFRTWSWLCELPWFMGWGRDRMVSFSTVFNS